MLLRRILIVVVLMLQTSETAPTTTTRTTTTVAKPKAAKTTITKVPKTTITKTTKTKGSKTKTTIKVGLILTTTPGTTLTNSTTTSTTTTTIATVASTVPPATNTTLTTTVPPAVNTTLTTTIPPTTATSLPHKPIYRFANGIGHFYTAELAELQNVVAHIPTIRLVGVTGNVIASPMGSVNVSIHRLYHRGTDDHLYCREAEKNYLVTVGWQYEGIFGYCSDTPQPNMSAWERLYNPTTLKHLMTNNQYEAKVIKENPQLFGYNYEGPLCYIYDN